MEALYTADERQRVEVTNRGDTVAFLAEKDLERHGPDNPFIAEVEDRASGELREETLTEVVYDGAATVAPGQAVEWVLGEGATLYGDGALEVEPVDARGPEG